MSVSNPAFPIPRWSVVDFEGMFVKMWDPPTESPVTPDFITPTSPVPEVMAAAGLANPPSVPHTLELDLLNGAAVDTWDGLKRLNWYMVGDTNLATQSGGTYPGPTIRMPRGVIYHATTKGKGPPPHTIHWHGMEPTPMNDGVGHCSMEIGDYTYQWQPAFIGTYFYHCHRNTMQHFEFGLFGLLLVEPPDAYFATQWDPTIPIGHCRDGKRRTAANLTGFPQFPNFVGGDIRDPDPEASNPNLPASLKFLSNPHAMTVAYDVEALWVFDDRDSVWSALAADARTSYPQYGTHPGYDDNFARNPGSNGFLAFNDYRADYWFVTGVPIPAHKGETAAIPPGILVPAELNSGISGSQVSVEAYMGQTILFRVLDAAYNNCVYTFPFDIVIIAWDGRALGVAPYGFNNAYLVPANTPLKVSVGRRFDALARITTAGNHLVECKFIDTRGSDTAFEVVTCTAQVPVNVSPLTVTATPNVASPQPAGTLVTFNAAMTGTPGSQAPTSGPFEFRFWLHTVATASWAMVQEYGVGSSWTMPANTSAGDYVIGVEVRGNSDVTRDAVTYLSYQIGAAAPATGVTITPDKPSPSAAGPSGIVFTAAGQGSAGYDYRFLLHDGTNWTTVQDYGNGATWTMPVSTLPGAYTLAVDVRTSPNVARDTVAYLGYLLQPTPATGVAITPNPASPGTAGAPVIFTAAGQGSAGYDYSFWLHDVATGIWSMVQDYGSGAQWTMPGTTAAGSYIVAANVRTSSAVNRDAVQYLTYILQ